MNEPPQHEAGNQDLIDLLIAISVVARHLARKLEDQDRNDAESSALQRGK